MEVLFFALFTLVLLDGIGSLLAMPRSICPDICPPGKYRFKCACASCPPDTFTAFNNTESRCMPCYRDCREDLHMEIVKRCSNTSNTVCKCQDGYACVRKDSQNYCEACEPQPSPSGLEKLTPTEAAETSAPCEPGAFYSETFRKCEKHKNCTSLGLSVVTAGNSTHDAVCDSPTTSAVSKISPVHTAPVSPVKEEKSLLFLCVVCVCISVFLIGVNFASRCHLSKWRASGLRIPRDVEEEDVQKPIQEVCGKLETCYTENY